MHSSEVMHVQRIVTRRGGKNRAHARSLSLLKNHVGRRIVAILQPACLVLDCDAAWREKVVIAKSLSFFKCVQI